jgi:hypothetical protein
MCQATRSAARHAPTWCRWPVDADADAEADADGDADGDADTARTAEDRLDAGGVATDTVGAGVAPEQPTSATDARTAYPDARIALMSNRRRNIVAGWHPLR